MLFRITHCPTCGSKQIKKIRRNWTGKYKNHIYTVPALEFYECPVCGEKVYDRDAMHQIEAHSPGFARPSPHPTINRQNDPTESELVVEDARWKKTLTRHATKFAALKSQAKADVKRRKSAPMFNKRGKFLADRASFKK